MKRIFMMLMMTMFCLSTSFAFDIPASPNPPKLINDYIGLLQSNELQALENKLVEFNNKTSIQITVVILDDLDGAQASDVAVEIGQNWGVGQKGIDNGIVFLIVKYSQSALEKLMTQKHGDWYMAVGYGLEPYLTDYDAKYIAESNFIPFAKQDQYYEGIDATVNAIMEDLGEVGWQQREELEEKRKAKAAEAMRKFGNGLVIFFICAAILGLVIFLFVSARKAYQKAQEIKQRRESLKKTFYGAKSEFENLLKRIPSNSHSYPTWAVELHDKIINNIERASKDPANDVIKEFPVIVESNMVRASQILSILTGCVHGLEKSIAELEAIPNEIKKYKEEAPAKLSAAEEQFQEFATSINVLKDKGFKLALYEKELGEFKVSLANTKGKVNSKEDKSKDIFLESIGICEGIEGTIQSMSEYLSNREAALKIVTSLNTKIQSIPAKKESAQKVLDQIKAENPKQNWEDLEKAFGSVTALLSLCKGKMEESEVRNGMDIQDFNTAKSFADEADEKMQKILNIFHDIQERKDEIENAKSNYASLLRSAESAISSAKTKCEDSDVEENSKEKLLEANTKLNKAKTASSESLINWLFVVSLLISAKSLANEAYTMAESDIEEAEEEREEAAATAAAAAAALLASQRNTYHSSPSPSIGGGGFGGFGGGSFGGGGAGGSW